MSSQDISPPSPPASSVQAVLIMDLVESVRIMEENPRDTVQRWQQLAGHVRNDLLPVYGGRLVETRGDSLLLTFPNPGVAVQTAFAIKRYCAILNEGMPFSRQFHLRTGIHVGEIFASEHEVLGHTVNIAARLMTTVAGPGEIVISEDVQDQLTPVLDADVEDLGIKHVDTDDSRVDDLNYIHLKHVSAPVRAYRVGPPGPRPIIEPGAAMLPVLRPTVAVIPFTNRTNDPAHDVVGEVLADDIISALSRTVLLNVVSRLSTTAFRGRPATLDDIGAHLKADYVLSGKYSVSGVHLRLDLELAEVRTGHIRLSPPSIKTQIQAVVNGDDGWIDQLVADIGNCVVRHELQRGQSQALPTLDSYTLLMNAIVRMHRGSPLEFERACQMLQALTERIPKIAIPHAWLAKWHVLRFNRGLSENRQRESVIALDCTKRALDADPDCSLALTIDGFVHTNLLKRFDIAEERYTQALEVNPNESLAWLLKGTMHAFKGEGEDAVAHTQRALKLSPLDPLRYFYESLAATAAHSAGHYERAIELAQRSLRANRMHTSTLRVLTIAQSELGRMDDARKTAQELLKLDTTLTVRRYLDSNPSGPFETGKAWAEALRRAGIPD